MKKSITTILLTIAALATSAQEISPTTLSEMLTVGLEHNYELKIMRAEEQQSANSATLLNSGKLPTADFSAAYDFNSDEYNAYQRADGSRTNYHDNDNAIDLGIGLDWTIFDGFYITATYDRLKEIHKRTEVETRIAIEDFVADFAAEYFNNVKEQQRLANLRSAVELSRERLRIVRARYVVGSFSRLDLQQARVDFNVDSANLIKQDELLYTSSVNIAQMMVKDDVTEPISIPDTLIEIDTNLNYDDLLAATLSNNTEMLYAQHNTSIAQLDYKRVLARDYPSIDLDMNYGYDNNFFSRGTTTSNHTLGFNAGLSASFTIFDGSRRINKKNAKLDIESAKLTLQDVELGLRAELAKAWQGYTNNMKLLNLERTSLIVAQENYEIAMERYMLGNLSGIEMREAQLSLLDAEERIVDATYSTKIYEITLMLISGNISKYL